VLVPLNSARIRHHKDKHHYVVPGEDRDVEVHWSKVGRTYRGWRTPLIDTLLLLADCVPLDWWIAAIDAAVHQPRDGGDRLLSEEGYDDFAGRVPRRLQRALRLVDGRADSPLETLLRLGLIRRGIGPFVPQFSPDGRREVDLLVGRWLIVEADGEAFHEPEKDRIRDAFFRRLGYVVLRFSYDRIVHDLDRVLDEIEEALASLRTPAF
jgi:very-short-patch-repair endonuclease